jgi:hypothetical protein
MIPKWLVEKRTQVCLKCERLKECRARFEILHEAPSCPLKKLPSKADEIAAKAWPAGAEPISGCCDSALNY